MNRREGVVLSLYMGSIAAKKVALEVLENTRTGKKPNVYRTALKYGYAETTARTAEVQKTKTYKDIIDPALNKYIKLRDKTMDALLRKDPDTEAYHTLSNAVDRYTHAIQLLSGKSTEKVEVNEDKRILLAVIDQLRLPPKSE